MYIKISDQKKFKVEVLDQNDNPPRFEQPTYNAEIAEDADINSKVIEVTARDKDDFAVIRYDITDGNVDNAFMVEEKSGVIRVNNQLDYEKITDVRCLIMLKYYKISNMYILLIVICVLLNLKKCHVSFI